MRKYTWTSAFMHSSAKRVCHTILNVIFAVNMENTYVAIRSGKSGKAMARVVVYSIWTVSLETGWTLTFIDICQNVQNIFYESQGVIFLSLREQIAKIKSVNELKSLDQYKREYEVYSTLFRCTNIDKILSFLHEFIL